MVSCFQKMSVTILRWKYWNIVKCGQIPGNFVEMDKRRSRKVKELYNLSVIKTDNEQSSQPVVLWYTVNNYLESGYSILVKMVLEGKRKYSLHVQESNCLHVQAITSMKITQRKKREWNFWPVCCEYSGPNHKLNVIKMDSVVNLRVEISDPSPGLHFGFNFGHGNRQKAWH